MVAQKASVTVSSKTPKHLAEAHAVPKKAETVLYAPVKRFLEARGYEVKGEVYGCDVVGVRAGVPASLAVVELKLGLTLDLVLQGVDRMALADVVWLAVAASSRGRIRDARAVRLCHLLGFGLLAVDAARGRIEVLAEPAPYRPRKSRRRRERVVREHQDRHGDPMPVRIPVRPCRVLGCRCGQARVWVHRARVGW